ncbi:DUF222 domain-containing protein, partial [Subtercola boreus]|uniref:DUF222 domain-containing protein n=1 Tax=Subtercola boreus TaxID=120213 RepID=UPI0011C021A8
AQPRTAVQRHLDAAARRRLDLDPATDGMAYLTLYLPAVEAVAIHNRATDLARSAKTSGDPRTPTQLRLDTLTDLLLNADPTTPGTTQGIRARIHVTVPALTLLGTPTPTRNTPGTPTTATHDGSTASDPGHPPPEPSPGFAQLEGYGPIDRLTALHLTRHAPTFTRVLTDPATGCALTY